MKWKNYIRVVKIETRQLFRIHDVYLIAFSLPLITIVIINVLAKGNSGVNVLDSFSGIMSIGIIGTGIMGLSSIVTDYRHNGVLKRLSVTPVRPFHIVSSICIGLFLISLLSSVLVIFEYYLFFDIYIQGSLISFLFCYLLSVISTFAVGIIISSIASNRNIANIVTILIYFPSLLLSGTTIPRSELPYYISLVSDILPATHSIAILQNSILGRPVDCFSFSVLYLYFIVLICGVILNRRFVWKFK